MNDVAKAKLRCEKLLCEYYYNTDEKGHSTLSWQAVDALESQIENHIRTLDLLDPDFDEKIFIDMIKRRFHNIKSMPGWRLVSDIASIMAQEIQKEIDNEMIKRMVAACTKICTKI